MPDFANVRELINSLPCTVTLPEAWYDFFSYSGPVATNFSERRQVPRFYARTRAAITPRQTIPALRRDPQTVQVLVKDISRTGVCIVTGEQFFPREELAFLSSDGVRHNLRVVRCHKIQAHCYEVATRFLA